MTTVRKFSITSLTVLLGLAVFLTPSFSYGETCLRAKIKAVTGSHAGNGGSVKLINDTAPGNCSGIPNGEEFTLSLPAEHTFKILNVLLTAAATQKRVFVSFLEDTLHGASIIVIDHIN